MARRAAAEPMALRSSTALPSFFAFAYALWYALLWIFFLSIFKAAAVGAAGMEGSLAALGALPSTLTLRLPRKEALGLARGFEPRPFLGLMAWGFLVGCSEPSNCAKTCANAPATEKALEYEPATCQMEV